MRVRQRERKGGGDREKQGKGGQGESGGERWNSEEDGVCGRGYDREKGGDGTKGRKRKGNAKVRERKRERVSNTATSMSYSKPFPDMPELLHTDSSFYPDCLRTVQSERPTQVSKTRQWR